MLGQTQKPPEDAEPATKATGPATRRLTTPPYRRLRAFAFDPLLSNQLDTLGINQVTVQVPWEDGLQPGPVGEYLEVIDHDPAGGCFYEPVRLNANWWPATRPAVRRCRRSRRSCCTCCRRCSRCSV